jgi:hypothetical protein
VSVKKAEAFFVSFHIMPGKNFEKISKIHLINPGGGGILTFVYFKGSGVTGKKPGFPR